MVEFEFIDLPSVNTHYNKHFRPRSISTAEWRYDAKTQALECLDWGDIDPIPRAFVLVNVYPPVEEISDVHNAHIKPVLDGFTEAGLWADDDWVSVPFVAYRWAGNGEHRPREKRIRKTIFQIYTLDALYMQGQKQVLPKRRIWL